MKMYYMTGRYFAAAVCALALLMTGGAVSAHGGGGWNDIYINTGGGAYTDSQGNDWIADTLYNTGNSAGTSAGIANTIDDAIYQSERWDPADATELQYAITVPNGDYNVYLHFAETFNGAFHPGGRVFDVLLEGSLVLDNYDIYTDVGENTAVVKSFPVTVADGILTIDFGHVYENPKISGIEVHQVAAATNLIISPSVMQFQDTNVGETSAAVSLAIDNFGTTDITITDLLVIGTDAVDFSFGSTPPLLISAGSSVSIDGFFSPTAPGVRDAELEILSDDAGSPHYVDLSGIGFDTTPPAATDIYINTGGGAYTDSNGNDWQADQYFNTGNAFIDGNGISGTTDDAIYQSERWDPADATELQYVIPVPNGEYEVVLHFAEIYTGAFSTGARVFDVQVEGQPFVTNLDIYGEVGGFAAVTKSTQITVADNALTIDFGHVTENPKIAGIEIHSTNTPPPSHYAHAVPGAPQTVVDGDFSGGADVNLDGSFSHTHAFGESIIGWTWRIGSTVIATGETITVTLPVGIHIVELDVIDGAGNSATDFTTITVETGAFPNVTTLTPSTGDEAGGTLVTISGSGFTALPEDTLVHFGPVTVSGTAITIINPNTIEIISPAGTGSVTVSVETPAGNSPSQTFTYLNTGLPTIQFTLGTILSGMTGPTSIAFGPDKRLYVGTQYGDVYAITLDENYNPTDVVVSSVIQTSEPQFRSILGIAFNPYDTDPTNPIIYVAHSQLFHGQSVDIYNGKISTLSGANLSVKQDIITGLPVSDHDHGINGLEFDNDGKLYIQVGGLTNAGVPGALSTSGTLDEKALSAATLVADIMNPTFDGTITYDASGNQTGGDVSVFVSGERNPFDLVLHTNGNIYGTDNGPNNGFGQKSVGCAAEGSDPSEGDELNLLVQDGYYGHPNRFRGATDSRQCVWRSHFEPSDSDYKTSLATFPASTNGITEYRADTFGGQLKGHLLLSRWTGELYDVELSGDGQSVISNTTLTSDGGLDVTVGPDGTIFIGQNSNGQVIFHKPIETPTGDITINNIFPHRGPIVGGNTLTISGYDLTTYGAPSVTVGGQSCPVINANAQEITCTVPQGITATSVDVTVSAGAQNDSFTGYRYIGTLPVTPTTAWSTLTDVPEYLGEVASVTDGTYVYLLGGQYQSSVKSDKLYRYNPATDSWTTLAPQNVVPTTDHASVGYINGKIYLFGGLIDNYTESNALGIYDIATDTWTTGAPLTINGSAYGIGSAGTTVINGKLYVAGGIHNQNQGGNTVVTAVYDPSSDSWTQLADMPSGRNHPAGGSLNNKFYIFAGRQGPNIGSPGYNDTFIYDVVTNTWSTGANVPTARSGMGSAPALNGELYVIGGEVGGPFAGTYEEVEVYNPVTNTWRTSDPLPTPRHGIWPVTLNNQIYVSAGGKEEGLSTSNVHEVYGDVVVPQQAMLDISNSLPSGKAVGAGLDSQVLGQFTFNVTNSPVNINSIDWEFTVTSAVADSTDITNVVILDEIYTTVAGPIDPVSGIAVTTDPFTIPVGSHTYTVRGDLSSNFVSGDSINVTLTPNTISATEQNSGTSITPSPSLVNGSLVTVNVASLSVTINSSQSNQTVVPGATDVEILALDLNVTNSGSDIRVMSIAIDQTHTGGSFPDLLGNFKAYIAGAPVTIGAVSTFCPGGDCGIEGVNAVTTLTFAGSGIILPKGSIQTLSLTADVDSSAPDGTFNFGCTDCVTAIDEESQLVTPSHTNGVGPTITISGTPPPVPTVIRINAGGGAYTDSNGNDWQADQYFNTGNTYITGNGISGTTDDALYQSERWDDSPAPELTYDIPLENGTYQVTLLFADIYSGTHWDGARVFDIDIEGNTMEAGLDIYSHVGGYTAYNTIYLVNVTDGSLTITFNHFIENPKISAIEAIKQ